LAARALSDIDQSKAAPVVIAAKKIILLALPLALCGLFAPSRALAVGSWSQLANSPPGPVCGMLLLSDGTIMAAAGDGVTYSSAWYRLTPDTNGSYVNGNWTTLNSMHDTRLYYGTQVLKDGRVFIAGGEYGSGSKNAEIFNPLTGNWAYTSSSAAGLGDTESELLPDGRVLVAPVGWGSYPQWATLIYDPVADSWSFAGSSLTYQDEASWVKLPDNSILTIDPYNDGGGTNSERFIPLPGPGAWINDAHPPVTMFNAYGETGPAFLVPDGRAFFVGGTGHTVFYSPTGNTNKGSWARGPDIPNGMAMDDAAGAVMFNGKILCAVSPPMTGPTTWAGSTYFYEFDPSANSWNTNAPSPTGGSSDSVYSYETMMLELPTGNILYSHFGSDLYVYQPDGSPIPAGKPVISSLSWNANGSVHLTGTGFNGISEGADYGDDFQPHSNYPLVRITSGGSVYYGTTFNWSSTGVATGAMIVSTEFTVPRTLPPGNFSLVVVANGIASDSIAFSGPVWVDFNYSGVQNGSYQNPYNTLAQGVSAVASGGRIIIKTAGSSSETMTISKPMTITAAGGAGTVGH
jgi:hypothetical protein